MDLRQENSIAKVFLAHMVHHVIDTAIQLHGALGFSQDTILAKWYTQVRSQRLVDGPDEVHKWKVGRNVIKAYREHGTTASAAGGGLILCDARIGRKPSMRTTSWPGLSRPSTSCGKGKTWMPGTRPGMTIPIN